LNKEEHIRRLLEKYENNSCTAEELRQLEEWLEQKAAAGKPWTFSGDAERTQLKEKIRLGILARIEPAHSGAPRRIILQPVWKGVAAAAVFLCCVWGIARLINKPKTLVLTSAPGHIQKVLLPDGSTAWLNENTELAYHKGFAGDRTIELRRGEGYFDVKKDPAHPFTVKSNGLTTTVLGTSFSAKLIGGSGDLKISVVTGKVMVSSPSDTLGILQPSQRLRYDRHTGRALVDSMLTGEADGWIHGDIFFRDASLAEVIQWLQDHFKVTVYNKRLAYTGEYYLQAKSDIPLPEMVKILNLLGKKDHVQFSLQGQTMIIQ
jgi:transmembrane sensor